MSESVVNKFVLIVDEIKSKLDGKEFTYVPMVVGEKPFRVKISSGRIFAINEDQSLGKEPLFLPGVSWKYLLELYNKSASTEDVIVVADPATDLATTRVETATKPKRESGVKPMATESSTKNTADRIVYYCTPAQKRLLLQLKSENAHHAANHIIHKLTEQWGDSLDKASIAHLSFEECKTLGRLYVEKREMKGMNSLIAKTEWIESLKFD